MTSWYDRSLPNKASFICEAFRVRGLSGGTKRDPVGALPSVFVEQDGFALSLFGPEHLVNQIGS